MPVSVVDVRVRSRTAFVNMFVCVRLRSFTDLKAAATMFVNKHVHEPFVYVRLSIARRAAQEGHTRAKIGHTTRDLSKGLRLASGSGLGRGQVVGDVDHYYGISASKCGARGPCVNVHTHPLVTQPI